MTDPSYWHSAINYLGDKDLIMSNLIASYPNEMMKNHQNPFLTLVKAIVGQQISVKAAAAIFQKLESRIGTFSPKHYLELGEDELRALGLSRQKIRYITNVANGFTSELLTPEKWEKMSEQEIEKQLTSITGIGTWTAQMFLIFYLHCPDILPLDDIGLLKAVALHYNSGNRLSKIEVASISRIWQPYRTVATWYLWRSLDPIPVQY